MFNVFSYRQKAPWVFDYNFYGMAQTLSAIFNQPIGNLFEPGLGCANKGTPAIKLLTNPVDRSGRKGRNRSLIKKLQIDFAC